MPLTKKSLQERNAKPLQKSKQKSVKVCEETRAWLTKQSKARSMSVDEFIQALRFRVIKP